MGDAELTFFTNWTALLGEAQCFPARDLVFYLAPDDPQGFAFFQSIVQRNPAFGSSSLFQQPVAGMAGKTVIVVATTAGHQALALASLADIPCATMAVRSDLHWTRVPLVIVSPPKAGSHLASSIAEAFGYVRSGPLPYDPKGGHWYTLDYESMHTSARDYFTKRNNRGDIFGGRLQPFSQCRVLVMTRHPRDILRSRLDFNFDPTNTVFGRYMEGASRAEKLAELTDPGGLFGDFADEINDYASWLRFPNAIPIGFEELQSNPGLVWQLQLLLQADGATEDHIDAAFGHSATYRNANVFGDHPDIDAAIAPIWPRLKRYTDGAGYRADSPLPTLLAERRTTVPSLSNHIPQDRLIDVETLGDLKIVWARDRFYAYPSAFTENDFVKLYSESPNRLLNGTDIEWLRGTARSLRTAAGAVWRSRLHPAYFGAEPGTLKIGRESGLAARIARARPPGAPLLSVAALEEAADAMPFGPTVIGIPRSGFALLIAIMTQIFYRTKHKFTGRHRALQIFCDTFGRHVARTNMAVFERFGVADRVIYNPNFRSMVGGPIWNDDKLGRRAYFRKYIGLVGIGDLTLITSHPLAILDQYEVVHSHGPFRNWIDPTLFPNSVRYAPIRTPLGIINSACHSINAVTSEYLQRVRTDLNEEKVRLDLATYKLTDLKFFQALLDPLKRSLTDMAETQEHFRIVKWEDIITDGGRMVQALAHDAGAPLGPGEAAQIWQILKNRNLTAAHRHNYRRGKAFVGDEFETVTNRHIEILKSQGFDEFYTAFGYPPLTYMDERRYTPFQAKVARCLDRGEVLDPTEDRDLFNFAFQKSNIDFTNFDFRQHEWRTHVRLERSNLTQPEIEDALAVAADEAVGRVNAVLEALLADLDGGDPELTQTQRAAADHSEAFAYFDMEDTLSRLRHLAVFA